jgi:Zn-dependent peptidase ImmA (M78 family)
MNGTTTKQDQPAVSMLARLRKLAPERPLRFSEALKVAELQASWLLTLRGIEYGPIPAEIITGQRRIAVEYDFKMPAQASGASDWDFGQRRWVITINGGQQVTRQRFTLFHEYKHILDHGRPGVIGGDHQRLGRPSNEYIADYFAGCVLMPRTLIKRAWGSGIQRLTDLAALFDVSERAIEVRLSQVGLIQQLARCAPQPSQQRKEIAA